MKTGAEVQKKRLGGGLGKDSELNANNADIALGVDELGVVRRDPEPCVRPASFSTHHPCFIIIITQPASPATPHRLERRWMLDS